jgi:hypothetical protein
MRDDRRDGHGTFSVVMDMVLVAVTGRYQSG